MQKKRDGRMALFFFIAVYGVIGLYNLLQWNLTALDSFTAVAVLGGAFLLARKQRTGLIPALCAGLIFLPNTIGHMGAYSWAAIDYRWDWIVHFVSSFLAVICISLFLLDNKLQSRFASIAFAFLFTISAGAFVEAVEYWGFRTIGFGEGYLAFGDGDNSENFGPWENSSLDTTFNFIGAGIGAVLCLRFKERKIKKNAT